MEYDVILLCAGKGNRFNKDKIICLLKEKPLFSYSLSFFTLNPDCKNIIIACNENNIEFIKKYTSKNFFDGISKINFIIGGQSRSDSVQNAIYHVKSEYIIIHDGARPFIDHNDFRKILVNLRNYVGVTLGMKATNAIKMINNEKIITLERDNLFEIITPQGFLTSKLIEAYKIYNREEKIYDDLEVIEKVFPKARIKIINAENTFIKITYPLDLQIATTILENNIYE